MWSSSSEEEAETAPRAPETRQFDRAKLNVPLAETEVDLDDEVGVPLLAPAPEATTAAPLFPSGAKSKRNIVVLSSDEENEGSDGEKEASVEESEMSDEEKEAPLDNTAPWSAEEDAKLRWLLESYQGMVDPWGMVAYDAFFLKARRSQRNVMQRAMELGLLDPSTELPEEENSDREREEKESDEEKEEESNREKEKDSNREMEKDSNREKEKDSNREMEKDSNREKEKEKEKEKKDAYSFEQRSEFIKTNLTRICQKVKVEKAVEILEPLLCLLERGVTHRQLLKQKGERVGGKSVRVTLSPSVPAQMRGQVALLLRSLRLQPTDTDVTIPSELAPQDFQQMLKVVETQVKRWKYQLNRKANKKRVASEEEEEEEMKTKKRRVVVDDSDLRVC